MFGRRKGQLQDSSDLDDASVVETTAVSAGGFEPEPASLPESPATQARRLPPAGVGGAAPSAPPRAEGTTVGARVTLEGTLRFGGRARIEGTFRGTIAAGTQLEVGPSATVEATVHVDALTIQGRVAGDVAAEQSVEIQAGGRMKGDIKTPAFQVHRGAFFNGHCEMGEG